MPNQRFTEELIHAHTELSKRACKQERMLEWLAKWIAYEFPCAFSSEEERRCMASGGDRETACWHCWLIRASREVEKKEERHE